jgi:hypothetical protein
MKNAHGSRNRSLTVAAPIGAARVRDCEKIERENKPFCRGSRFGDWQRARNTFFWWMKALVRSLLIGARFLHRPVRECCVFKERVPDVFESAIN